MTEQPDWVKIERLFDASIDEVWDLWTNASMFQQWYGPKGMSIPVAEMDVQVGGLRKICMSMQMPNKEMTMWFTGAYKEVSKPNRLVYTESMCDQDGNIISPQSMGMPEDHPDITEVIVELSQANDKTKMTLTHVGVKAGTAGGNGWNQAFDKLEALVNASSNPS